MHVNLLIFKKCHFFFVRYKCTSQLRVSITLKTCTKYASRNRNKAWLERKQFGMPLSDIHDVNLKSNIMTSVIT